MLGRTSSQHPTTILENTGYLESITTVKMATKKDMRRDDLSKLSYSIQPRIFLSEVNYLSYSLSRTSFEGWVIRFQQHYEQHITDGRYVHEKQVHRLVRMRRFIAEDGI